MNKRWTEQDILLAKALKNFNVDSISSYRGIVYWNSAALGHSLPRGCFSSLNHGETVTIDEIINYEL